MIQNKNPKINFQKLSIISYFAALSITISIFFSIPIPIIPFLKLDLCDFPIYSALKILDVNSVIIILLIVSFLRSFVLGIAGWPGFFMRITSILIIFNVNFFLNFKKNKFVLFFSSSFFLILSIFFKIFIGYLLWVHLFLISKSLLNNFFFSLIFPFNLLKELLNLMLTCKLIKILETNYTKY